MTNREIRPAFDTDLFLVSSEREKRLVTQDMGYARPGSQNHRFVSFFTLLRATLRFQTSDARHSDVALVVTDALQFSNRNIISSTKRSYRVSVCTHTQNNIVSRSSFACIRTCSNTRVTSRTYRSRSSIKANVMSKGC